MQPAKAESFLREVLRNLAGMLLVSVIFGVPMLAVFAILRALAGRLERGWMLALASAAIIILVPFCMTATFRLAKRFAHRWPFS